MKQLIEGADYFVRLVPFPPGSIDGMVTPNDDGTYSIYIDSNVNTQRQKKALDHELNHIMMGHFSEDIPVDVIESEADSGSIRSVTEKDWMTSWRLAMLWSREMMRLYGWSDKVPEYDPAAWRIEVSRRGLM